MVPVVHCGGGDKLGDMVFLYLHSKLCSKWLVVDGIMLGSSSYWEERSMVSVQSCMRLT